MAQLVFLLAPTALDDGGRGGETQTWRTLAVTSSISQCVLSVSSKNISALRFDRLYWIVSLFVLILLGTQLL